MSFLLNEEQVMLQQAAHDFLTQKGGVPQLRKLRDDDDQSRIDSAVWQEMIDMGWTGISTAEEYQGLGFGYTGLGLVLQEVGRSLTPSPIGSSTLIASTLLNEFASEGQKLEFFPKLVAGECRFTSALQESQHFSWNCDNTKAVKTNNGWELSGSKLMVLDAVDADKFIVSARTEELTQFFIVDADRSGVKVERRISVDARVSAKLTLEKVELPQDCVLGEGELSVEQTNLALDRALDIINIGLAAELLGLAEGAFSRTIAYLKERQQFDKYIGSFQGLQHRAAHLYSELELCKSLVMKALSAIDSSDQPLSIIASAAKSKLCEVTQNVTNEAIQMHGGVGMTDEYEIGFYIKRARVLQHLFGDANFHYDRFATLNGY